jgi:hypothetical protein
MVLLFLFWESTKNAKVYLLLMQSSAAAPQASDRIWCKRAMPALTAIRFQFVVGAHPAPQVHAAGRKS